jgi:hypothetical protein
MAENHNDRPNDNLVKLGYARPDCNLPNAEQHTSRR